MQIFHIFRIHGFVDNSVLERFRLFLKTQEIGAQVLLHIRSHGGISDSVIKIFNLIQNSSQEKQIDFYAFGYEKVDSYALPIYLACPFRAAQKDKIQFLLHEPKSISGSFSDEQKVQEEFIQLLLKRTSLDRAHIQKLINAGTYLTYDEAFACGIVNIEINKKSKGTS